MKLSKGKMLLFTSSVIIFVLGYIFININHIIKSVVFRPTPLAASYSYHFNRSFCQLNIYTSDGECLDVLHFLSVRPAGAILYFHGNKDNLQRWGRIAGSLTDFGWDVFVLDYRGYGKSTGSPDEQGLYRDAAALYRHIINNYSYKLFTFYGRSLGSGVATWLSKEFSPTGLILETPYYSLESLISRYIPFYTKLSDKPIKIESHRFLKTVSTRILILHGTKDNLIPAEDAQKLFDEIECSNKKLIMIPGGTHDNLPETKEYHSALNNFFEELRQDTRPTQNLN